MKTNKTEFHIILILAKALMLQVIKLNKFLIKKVK